MRFRGLSKCYAKIYAKTKLYARPGVCMRNVSGLRECMRNVSGLSECMRNVSGLRECACEIRRGLARIYGG